MKGAIKKVIIVLNLSIIIACNQNKIANSIELKKLCVVDIKERKSYELNDFFKSVSLLALETSYNCLIKNIERVVNKNNKFYVLDSGQSILFVFSKKGKFLYKIDQRGRGPQEYFRLDDFIVEDNGDVIIYDTTEKQVLFFDSKGILVNRFRNNFGAYYFEKNNNNTLFYSTENTCNYNFCSKIISQNIATKENKNYLKINARLINVNYTSDKPFYHVGTELFYLDRFNYCVYNLENNGIKEMFQIDFKNISPPKNWVNKKDWNSAGDFVNKTIKAGYASLIDNFVEDEKFVFFTFVYKNWLHYFYHNKQANDNKLAMYPLLNNANETFIFGDVVGSSSKKELITYKDVVFLKSEKHFFSEEQNKIIDGLDDMDNPVLLMFSF